MRRIGIIQVWQESNHFSPMLTRREDFESWGVGIGAAGLEQYGQGEEIGGFLRGLEDCEPVGLLMAQAWPGGPVSREARQWLIDELAAQLQSAGPLDGVLFALHGALVAEDEPDMDGLLLEQVRTAIGPGAPLVATLDMHAHPTPRMFAAADGFAAYHTNPHLDREQTGRRAARLLNRLFADLPALVVLKHEDWPGLRKLTRFRAAEERGERRRVSVLAGNGGLYLPLELARGAVSLKRRGRVLSRASHIASRGISFLEACTANSGI